MTVLICAHCGEKITVVIQDEKIAGLDPAGTHVMNFFCTKSHYDQWVAARGVSQDEIFCLDAQEALIVARMLFE